MYIESQQAFLISDKIAKWWLFFLRQETGSLFNFDYKKSMQAKLP